MAEPFKNLVNGETIRRVAEHVRCVYPTFDADGFVASAEDGLERLELKARVAHVARALRPRLPANWPDACAVLVAALPPALPGEEAVSGQMWLWPLLKVVEDHGAADPEVSFSTLREMTRRFSAEFAVRPLLAAHPALGYATLARWADDPDVHVRRLVSEGSRPRLPWGMRLQDAVRDPASGLALIERLVDDPSPYVRRSVANHLGDVAKDHPDVAVAVARRWDRPALTRHALRDLLKKGHPGALALFGATPADATELTARVEGDRVRVTARVTARAAGPVRVDLRWEWPGARGGWAGKTFRGAEKALEAGESWAFSGTLSLRPVTTRPLRPGPQQVWVRVSGVDHGPVGFVLAG